MAKTPSAETQLRTARREIDRLRQDLAFERGVRGRIDGELRRVDHLVQGAQSVPGYSTVVAVANLTLRLAELAGQVAAYERVFQAVATLVPGEE